MLDQNNRHRQTIEAQALITAQTQAEAQTDASVVMVHSADWHPGVIGIMASRLMHTHNKPACVISITDGVGKGSARSIEGVDIGAHIIAAHQTGLLMNGGGHEMAGGFTVAGDKLEAFRRFMDERIGSDVAADNITPRLHLDALVPLRAVSFDLIDDIATLGPFGQGNPTPRFALEDVRIAFTKVLKDKHIACTLEDLMGKKLSAIAFNCVGTPLGDALLNGKDRQIQIAGQAKRDTWNGASQLKFFIDDIVI